jgi:hypothetical protein
MNKKVKAKTFTLVAINDGYRPPFYAFLDSLARALCSDFVRSYLGKVPGKIKVRVRATMAAGYTKAWFGCHCVAIGEDWNPLFPDAIEALDSVFGTRKTFYFKITEVKC